VRALEAEAVLLRRLEELGVSCERRSYFRIGAGRDARPALDVFMAFAAELIDEPDDANGTSLSVDRFRDGDLLLFETGLGRVLPPAEKPYWSMSDEPVPEVYELSFTRQFSFEDSDGEYHGMNTVSLIIQAEPTSALTGLANEQIWGSAGPAWARDELVAQGHDPDRPPRTGAAAWQKQVTASRAISTALAVDPTLFYIVQSDV
jgi:hypothetical protein